jgi:hypothetical protein
MATPAAFKYHISKFWDDQFKTLGYISEPFNDPESVAHWLSQGYYNKFCGELCDMRHNLPKWADSFINIYTELGWKDIGLAFYRMGTGTVLPVHSDLYKRYIEVFDLQGREHTIKRAIVLLEDWKSGHYLEVNNVPYTKWIAGDTVEWVYSTPHMAANLGLEDRYTLQITGHL